MLFGTHVSIAGGLPNAPQNAAAIGCEVFQIFTRSPRGGWVAPLDETIAKEFKKRCKEFGLTEWYVHTPYFIHFASANNRIKYGSISVVREELERASLLGAKYVMTHQGSYKDLGKEKGFKQLIESLEKVLKDYKGSTQLLLELSAGAGDAIGDTFEEMAEVLNHPKLKKYDIGVCFDTQHAFAAGYDIRTPEAVNETLTAFDKLIGLNHLCLFHCNDSKTDFGSNSDRHEHIGDGKIGLDGFRALFNDRRLHNKNFNLETEHDKIVQDIQTLKRLREEVGIKQKAT